MADARVQKIEGKNRHLRLFIESLKKAIQQQEREIAGLRREVVERDKEIAGLRREVVERDAVIAGLESQVEELVEAVRKLGARVSLATPSGQKSTYEKARETERRRKEDNREKGTWRKKGRPEGAEGSTRERLTAADVEERRPVEETGCPHCGRPLADVEMRTQIVETVIPAKRRVVEYSWREGMCAEHGKVSLRPGDAAPKAHLSNEVILIAAELAISAGMSLEKVCSHLTKRFGIELTTGGLAQAFQRLALDLVEEVRAIQDKIGESEAVHADETGARVDGESWWMWAFVTRSLACFTVDPSRGSEVIFRVLGKHFLGVLISDFFSAYNVPDCRKQKCITHLLRDLKEILLTYEDRPGRRPPALLAMRQWAKDALLLKDKRSKLSERTYHRRRSELEKRLDEILLSKSEQPDVLRLLDRLWRHRDEVLLFLYVDTVEGTNNRVERAIRKAVLQRKVNGGHRSWLGAETYATLLSMLVTCDFQRRDFVQTGLEILQRHYRGLKPGVLVEALGKKHELPLERNRSP